MFPLGKWVFVATGVDSVGKQNCGFRYHINDGATAFTKLACRSDDFYPLTDPDAILSISGIADPNFPPNELIPFSTSAYAILQYVRLFLDYTPTTKDEFLNIALMEPASKINFFFSTERIVFQLGKLYVFHFASDSGTTNQSFIIEEVSSSDSSNTVGYKGTSS